MTTYVALVLALALGAPALAAAPAAASGTATATGEGGLMLVLDASGSMAEPAAGGASRIDAAQEALGAVIGDLPDSNRVGLRVFGATTEDLANPASCTDSQLLVPIGVDNRDALRDAVDRYEPFGETPIGYALQQAGQDLGESGQRAILLVSDGIANCEPDPCVVAAQLAEDDIDMRIDVIGLDVDEAAREQLQCIADRGRGDYLGVSEASSLQHALERLSARAFRPFGVVGEPVDGTLSADGAPALAAGAQYVDELVGDSTLHYLVDRGTPGSVIHVGIAGRLPHDGSVTVEGTLTTPDGEACDATSITALGEDRFSVFAGRVSAAEGSPEHACATAEQLLLSVAATTPPGVAVPFELRIAEHAWPSNAASLPAPADAERGWQLSLAGDGAGGPVVGGSSLNDAPLIAPGSYRTDMLPSEFQFFRVAAEWGQTLHVQASLDPAYPAPPSAYGILQVLDPVGADVSALLATTSDGVRWAQAMPEPGSSVAVTAAPVMFDGNPGAVKRPVMSGEYIVAVGFEADAGTTPSPLLVTIEVVGEPAGTPDLSGAPPVDAAPPPAAAGPALDAAAWTVVAVFAGVGLLVIALIAVAMWLRQRRAPRYRG
ncbi:vWA domain-containing protein [Agrococcus sp. DT81.2]|uniref:vWA domain-containing protein n=1 Tax=Agrococcus sp. DT81.2 TaxID=3393414 RepID=UPI003CE4E8A0